MSYLTSQTQTVTISDNCSSYLETRCGVPQGSVLGPSLFLIYINDISNIVLDSKLLLFADDTAFITTNADVKLVETNLSQSLPSLSEWFEHNNLLLNESKTITAYFSLKNILPSLKILILLTSWAYDLTQG